jgi:hypothetical protein
MHVPKRFLDRNDDTALGGLQTVRLLAGRARRVFVFSRKVNSASALFDTQTESWRSERIHVTFIRWRDIVELNRHPSPLFDVKLLLRIPETSARAPSSAVADAEGPSTSTQIRERIPERLSSEDIEFIIQTLANLAGHSPLGVQEYLADLVRQLDLPRGWSPGSWTGDPDVDARKLVQFLDGKHLYPPTVARSGCSVLGVLIEKLYPHSGDPVMRRRFLEMTSTNGLLPQADLERLRNL